jgi:hypothetical protein
MAVLAGALQVVALTETPVVESISNLGECSSRYEVPIPLRKSTV